MVAKRGQRQQQAKATEVLARAEAANVQSDASTSSGPVKAPVMNRICTPQTHVVRNTVYSPRAQDSATTQDSLPGHASPQAHFKGNFKAPPSAQDVQNFHPHAPPVPPSCKMFHTWHTGRVVDPSELAMLERWETYHGLGPTLVFKNPPPPRHPPPPRGPSCKF